MRIAFTAIVVVTATLVGSALAAGATLVQIAGVL